MWIAASVLRTEAVVQMCSVKKGVPKNFVKFTRIHQCQGLSFNKIAALRPATSLKRDYRTPFLWNTSGGCFCKKFLVFNIYKNILFSERERERERERESEISVRIFLVAM